MTLPIQVTFRNTEESDRIEVLVQKEAAKLEKFYPRIMNPACTGRRRNRRPPNISKLPLHTNTSS